MNHRLFYLTAAVLTAFSFAAPAHAQATRTWVSGVGDDANPCSRTAPCKTFPGAISKTAANGEINVLDPGGFGAVTITKAISIINDGVGEAGVIVGGTNGIIIAAGPNDAVILKGLTINGLGATGASLSGIQFNSGGSLTVDRCLILGFQGMPTSAGITFQPNSPASLTVTNTTVVNNGSGTGGGIQVLPASGGSAMVLLDNVHSSGNAAFGFKLDNRTAGALASSGVIRNSVMNDNGSNGVVVRSVLTGGPLTALSLDNITASFNGSYGATADGASATLRLTRSTFTGNLFGIGGTNGGTVASFENNYISGNQTDGSPTTTIAPK